MGHQIAMMVSPGMIQGIDQSVSPGIEGFILTFLLAAALWVLMSNMLPRLRNIKYQEDAERVAREAELATTSASADRDGTSTRTQDPA